MVTRALHHDHLIRQLSSPWLEAHLSASACNPCFNYPTIDETRLVQLRGIPALRRGSKRSGSRRCFVSSQGEAVAAVTALRPQEISSGTVSQTK